MSTSELRIRPSARIISTIGKDLVKDNYAAVVELVKNAYDADSSYAQVQISYDSNSAELRTVVEDFGHGMDLEVIENKWLVPATSDKLLRKTTPNGRPLQGRKGIGRFAAHVLGNETFLTSSQGKGTEISLLFDLEQFDSAKYLDDIPVLVDEKHSDRGKGTRIEIIRRNVSESDLDDLWSEKSRGRLVTELSKLLAPKELSQLSKSLKAEDDFDIEIEFLGFPNQEDSCFKVEPIGILDLFDYRIYGNIDSEGNANLSFLNQNLSIAGEETIKQKIFLPAGNNYPGLINLDLRVFDRDPESISQIIERGLKDPITHEKVGKQKARELLNEYYGVSIYRGKFGIRPYGDKDYDWLNRDRLRVNTPSLRVGHKQIIGLVEIQPEELSHLEEKSARDGLVENGYYEGLIFLLNTVLTHLEERRFIFREKAFLGGRINRTVDEQIKDLFDFDIVSENISKKISNLNIDKSSEQSVIKLINNEFTEERKKKEKQYQKVRETVALYQGQATLGKITHVLLHEGRKHIKVLSEIPPRVSKWIDKLLPNDDSDLRAKIIDRSILLNQSAKSISLLFKRIEPLAISRRPNRKMLNLKSEIKSCFQIFESELLENNISVEIEVDERTEILATNFDIVSVFANLIENSIYWLSLSKADTKKIHVESAIDNARVEIYFSDNGPGFQGSNIESMFEPGFSMKPDNSGSGLGLAIVGESIKKMNGSIQAIRQEVGAAFLLVFNKE